jgi:DNA-directed RNA polymerase subunit RPC12/RpoP
MKARAVLDAQNPGTGMMPKLSRVNRVTLLAGMIALVVMSLISGCEQRAVENALKTDANGYLCRSCKAKFYTDREVFANNCPSCKSAQLIQVVGFVCPADGHVTIGPRNTGSLACEKCGKATSGLSIPRETDFQAWGAPKKTKTEVGS